MTSKTNSVKRLLAREITRNYADYSKLLLRLRIQEATIPSRKHSKEEMRQGRGWNPKTPEARLQFKSNLPDLKRAADLCVLRESKF
jgi:hypothetical protein